MFDFGDISLRQHDCLISKYSDSIVNATSSSAMDLYLSAVDSISLQEMLDVDIKSEIDSVINGHADLAGFGFSELPPLELDDGPPDISMWFSTASNHSNSNFNLDFIGPEAAAVMVNPNSVMPLSIVSAKSPTPDKSPPSSPKGKSIEPLSFKPAFQKVKTEHDDDADKKPTAMESKPVMRITRNLISSSPVSPAGKPKRQSFRRFDDDEKMYPKPAYSYSCLIAMALKNSRTGSLPVSEIYNFMCKHFPYFKTAPNGWKNSVRHNLSLNKCFEKIEKPALSGTQRKGCLWAMNPSKISKMDEEVQKWSRKDPNAIRKAMTNPEHLEALERGDLKYICDNDTYGDSCDSGDDSEAELSSAQTTVDTENADTSADEGSVGDYDIEVSESMYDSMEIGDIKKALRVEMALAERELLANGSIKSRKDNFTLSTGHRRTVLVVQRNGD